MSNFIFDMDGLFYTYTHEMQGHFIRTMANAALELGVRLTHDEAAQIALDSYQTHKYGGHRFVHEHGICPKEICHAYDRLLDIKLIKPDIELLSEFRLAAEKYTPGKNTILTQSTDVLAEPLLAHLGIRDVFGAVVCLNHTNYELKSRSYSPFEKALEASSSEAKDSTFSEDTLANLIIPKKMGIRTVYVHHGKPLSELPSHVDAQVFWPDKVFKLDMSA